MDGLFEGTTSHSRSRSHSAVGRTPASRGNVSVGLTPGRGNRDTTSPLKRKLESLKDEKEYVPDIEVSDSPRVQAARAVVEVVEWVFSRWQDLISIKDEHPRPNALQRFDCGAFLWET